MRILIFLATLLFSFQVHAQSKPPPGAIFDRIAPKVKTAAPSYSKATMARDRKEFMRAYPIVEKNLLKRGHPKSDAAPALEASLIKLRKQTPNASLNAGFFSRRTLELVKAIITSSPKGATVEIFNASKDKTDTGTTDTSLWLDADAYVIEIVKDGYCSWKKDVILDPDETPVEFEVSLKPLDSDGFCQHD